MDFRFIHQLMSRAGLKCYYSSQLHLSLALSIAHLQRYCLNFNLTSDDSLNSLNSSGREFHSL